MSLMLALLLALQAPNTDPAVRKGLDFLKSKADGLGESGDGVLWTFVCAQVPEADPRFQRLLKELLVRPLESTRSVALQAMILQQLDPAAYRQRIGQCAQFLIDNQGADGQWDTGRTVPLPEILFAEPKPRPRPRVFGAPAPPMPKVQLKKLQAGPEKGNAADSRWALRGLLAAHHAGFIPPAEVPLKAELAWRSSDAFAADVISGLSMALFLQGKDHQKDRDVQKAIDRLAAAKRPNDPVSLALQRDALVQADTDKLGPDWWPEEAKTLLAAQKADGSWGSIDDTSAAIRFLLR